MNQSDPSSLNEFLGQREARSRLARQGFRTIPPHVEKEWSELKQRVRKLIGDRQVDGQALQWSPYPAPYPDFLLWKDVAAYFIEPDLRREQAPTFRIRFARRPLKANQIWILDESPLEEMVWKLDYREKTDGGAWITDDGAALDSEKLANAIAIQLIRFSDAYESASRNFFG